MKIYLSLIILITLLLIFANNVLSNHSLCWDVPDPMNLFHQIQKPCPMVKSSDINSKRAPVNGSDMFIISFSCSVENENPELCQKVKSAFDMAGQIITSEIKLTTPLVVNATFIDFCKTIGICRSGTRLTLGGAGPARLSLEQDQRIYPQPLLKQLVNENHTEFSQFDINAQFNSEEDYWFEGDGPIKPNQSDFLFVILHELIHGLGFASGWGDYSEILGIQNIITPMPLFLTETDTGQVIFAGFRELIFDKFMVILPDGTRVSDINAELNKFSGVGTRYASMNDFLSYFISTFPSSPQYSIAQRMMNISTTPKSLGILSLNKTDVKDAFILETSLIPFLPKSSISHCDYATYTKSSDFLMRYLQDPGVSLKKSIRLGGNYAGGPIGPKLAETLTLMGYQNQSLPNPFKQLPDEKEIESNQSTASYKLILSIVIFFLFNQHKERSNYYETNSKSDLNTLFFSAFPMHLENHAVSSIYQSIKYEALF
ncbi:hypothetical protein C1645_809537 [Glomus cerebriforme]|uniref:Sequence orphan n=1 Tax=Glomus cerebriforme TaxID=658196 RepID=A0A397SCR8_9GLOM|nr:hypothetical protein C1645_809537 [Glomus cerebriforme]